MAWTVSVEKYDRAPSGISQTEPSEASSLPRVALGFPDVYLIKPKVLVLDLKHAEANYGA